MFYAIKNSALLKFVCELLISATFSSTIDIVIVDIKNFIFYLYFCGNKIDINMRIIFSTIIDISSLRNIEIFFWIILYALCANLMHFKDGFVVQAQSVHAMTSIHKACFISF